MPIMAAQGVNDARAAARLLASAAKDCLDNSANAPVQATALNNVYRLLESYRVSPFFGFEPIPKSADTLSLAPPLERNVGVVREVLEAAVNEAFAGQSTDEALLAVSKVLQQVAYPKFGTPSAEDRAKAAEFFSKVVQHLQSA